MKTKIYLVLALFLLSAFSSMGQDSIDQLEYFWDTDPGQGNGIAISVPNGSIFSGDVQVDPSTVNAGYHLLGIRSRTADGLWGIPSFQSIYVQEIIGAEYFWNSDPGVGNAIPIAFASTDLSINTSLELSTDGFRPGPAVLGVRWQLKGGSWGPTTYKQFNIATEFTGGEYFWDTDPGIGNATSFSLPNEQDFVEADIEIDNSGLSTGFHNLYVRTKGLNGSYGLAKKKRIYIAKEIAGAEYFWDTDPGVGNGTALDVLSLGANAQICTDIPTTDITPGEHYFYVRTRTEDMVWSVPSRVQFIITENDVFVGCPGDFDRDGIVGVSDLLILLSAFGSFGDCTADLNGDLKVDVADLITLLSSFGQAC